MRNEGIRDGLTKFELSRPLQVQTVAWVESKPSCVNHYEVIYVVGEAMCSTSSTNSGWNIANGCRISGYRHV
jgi:hypothetical protein